MTVFAQGLLHSELAERADLRVVRTDYLNKENYSGLTRQVVNFANGFLLAILVVKNILVWRPHIVHIQSPSGGGFYEKSFLILLARLLGRKTLLHVHGGAFRQFFQDSNPVAQKIIRWCGYLPDRIVTASPQMRDTWRLIGLPDERIVWIDNAVPLPATTIWSADNPDYLMKDGRSAPTTILFLTRICYAKGVIELVDAFVQLIDSFPQLFLRIAGFESPESAEIKDYIAKYGIHERITYLGTVTDEQKSAELLSADLYAFPTHVEDQSYAVLEAMSYGLPCVATNVGGIPSQIEDGVNGILVPARNTIELRFALERLIKDPILRHQFGTFNRSLIEQKFTWPSLAAKMYSLYEKLVTSA